MPRFAPKAGSHFMLRMCEDYAHAGPGVTNSQGELLRAGIPIQSDPYIAYRDEDEADLPLGDLICRYNPLIVSHRASRALSEFLLPPDTLTFDVLVVDPATNQPLSKARGILFAENLHVVHPVDAIRLEKESPVDLYLGRLPPPIVMESAIGDLDILCGLHVLTLVSSRVKAAVEKHGLSGFRFWPVRTVP